MGNEASVAAIEAMAVRAKAEYAEAKEALAETQELWMAAVLEEDAIDQGEVQNRVTADTQRLANMANAHQSMMTTVQQQIARLRELESVLQQQVKETDRLKRRAEKMADHLTKKKKE